MLRQAIKAVNSKVISPPNRRYLEQVIRVDQAGELGADFIYAGQYYVYSWTKPELAPLIKHLWDQEVHHHSTFDALQTEGRVRPSLLTPVWKAAAFFLGASTALAGKEVGMACTEAVETVIGGHYNSQLRRLHEDFPHTEDMDSLKKIISQFRDDELYHLDTAIKNDAQKASPHFLIVEAIKAGCKGAIFLAERI